jgi:hypothetical protein
VKHALRAPAASAVRQSLPNLCPAEDSTVTKKVPHFGKLKPRYRFALNPFPEVRWSRCPRCEKLTHARKFPLLIHIDGLGLLTLGKTCRYCTPCEFIIADQAELEEQLVIACEERGFPEKVGNPYTVFATVERPWWKQSLAQHQLSLDDLRAHTADIKEHHQLFDPRPVLTSAPS